MRKLGRIVLIVLAVFGALGILATVGGIVAALSLADNEIPLPDRFVLSLDLDNGVSEGASDSPFERFSKHERYPIRDLIEDLEQALQNTLEEGKAACRAAVARFKSPVG